jgi:hypothetical protein
MRWRTSSITSVCVIVAAGHVADAAASRMSHVVPYAIGMRHGYVADA